MTTTPTPLPTRSGGAGPGDEDSGAVVLRHPTRDADLSPATQAVVKRHLLTGLLINEFEEAPLHDCYEQQALALLRQAAVFCQLAEARAVRRDRQHVGWAARRGTEDLT